MSQQKNFFKDLSRYLAYITLALVILFWIVPIFPWWLPLPFGLVFLYFARNSQTGRGSSNSRRFR